MSLGILFGFGGADLVSAAGQIPVVMAAAGGVEKLSLAVVVLELALVYLTALFGEIGRAHV